MSRKSDPWVRRFEVSDPCLHHKGYTIYKITSTVFPRNSPEASTEVVVWRRFSEIKRLHKALRIYHANLHLKGEFPSFSKDKLFGRFEPAVIEERRQSAVKLLEFVAQNPPLFTSQIFVNFFETGKQSLVRSDVEKINEDAGGVLQPVKLSSEACARQDEKESTGGEESLLSGVWQYRQTADEISLDSNDDSDDQEGFKENAESVIPYSSINEVDLEVFDPFSRSTMKDNSLDEAKANVSGKDNSQWLMSALAMCSNLEDTKVSSNDALGFPQAFAEYEDVDVPPQSAIKLNEFAPLVDLNQANNHEGQVEFKPVNKDDKTNLTYAEVNLCGSDYATEANRLLLSAKQFESKGDFRESFDSYKKLIEILLNGLKEELDPVKNATVRCSVTQYLTRAEKIYEKHLKNQNSTGNIRSIYYSPSNNIRQQLERYKVLGIINKVILVLDCTTNVTCVIKVLSKSVISTNSKRQSIVTQPIKNMVQLVRYHETEDSIFLVIQHAAGGRLWNFVGSYLQNIVLQNDANALESGAGECPSPTNVYIGRKLVSKTENEELQFDFNNASGDLLNIKPVNNISSEYVQLFNKKESDKGQVCLTNDQRVTFINKVENSSADEFSCDDVKRDESNFSTNHTRNISSRLCYEENISDEILWTNLKNVDTNELVSNAQKLMENVEETLRFSDKIANGTFDCDKTSPKKLAKLTMNDERPISPSIVQGIPRTRLRSRKTSEGDPFMVDRSPSVIRETSGSVELQRNRVRHFSSIFHQLDESSASSNTLPENYIRIWASEIIKCICSLHRLGIICKDLKPDNILLGENGHVLLTYFGQWPAVDDRVDENAKDNLYTAPELSGIFHFTPACDWWSVGALLFELFTGKTLISCHQGGFNSHTRLHIPTQVSKEAESLLNGLLCYSPNERLGSGPMGVESIKSHPFFKDTDWS